MLKYVVKHLGCQNPYTYICKKKMKEDEINVAIKAITDFQEKQLNINSYLITTLSNQTKMIKQLQNDVELLKGIFKSRN